VRGDVLPYLVPGDGVVRFSPWHSFTVDGWQPLPDRVPDWDPDTSLTLRREVDIDLARMHQECGLPPDTDLTITVTWISSTTGMRNSVPPVLVTAYGPQILDCLLPGDEVAGEVTIKTVLTLAQQATERTPGVAWQAGSILVRDLQTVAVGPADPPFPVHQMDFARTRLDPEASWHLETSTELNAPFLGTFLLLLNTRDKELIDAVARGRKTPRQIALLEELEHGVGTLLLELAVNLRDEIDGGADWPTGSIGNVLKRILDGSSRSSLHPPAGPHDLAEVKTMLSGAARAAGRGRRFL
jgi:hypothetical protein